MQSLYSWPPDLAPCLSKTLSISTTYRYVYCLSHLTWIYSLEGQRLLSGLFPEFIASILNSVWHKEVTPYMFTEWMKILINAWVRTRPEISFLSTNISKACRKASLYEKELSSNKFGKCQAKQMTFFAIGPFILNSTFPIHMTSDSTSSILPVSQEASLLLNTIWLIHLLFYCI